MLPHLAHRTPPWFAFVLHMRSRADMFRIGASSFLRNYSGDDDEFEQKVKTMPPTIVGEALFGFSSVRGELIAVLRTPEEMIGQAAVEAVRAAVKLAVSRGTKVIGLGALTSPVTNGGQMLLGDLPPGVTLTNGNGYTALVVRDNVREAAAHLGLGTGARVAVIGCTGSVGCAATQLLAADGYPLILIGRQRAAVHQVLGDVASACACEVSDRLDDARTADVVVTLASNAQLLPAHVRPGALVIDACHPASVPAALHAQFAAQSSPVLEGGLVRIPAYRSTYDMGTPSRLDTFACLAETYLFARQGLRGHSVGRPSVELAEAMDRAAQLHGITARSVLERPGAEIEDTRNEAALAERRRSSS